MKKIIAVLAVLVSVTSAHAAEKDWAVGGLVGYGIGENSFSGFTWGATVEKMLNPSWSADLYWSNTKKDFVSVMPLMLEVNYWLADMKGFYVGPRLGLTFTKQDAIAVLGTASSNTSDFTVGAQVGYDHEIATDWTVGINANWNLIMATSSSSLFNFVVPVKYHF